MNTPTPERTEKTPETDEEEKKPYPFSTNLTKYRGMRNLARSLERRLAAARAEVGELVEHNNLCNNSVAEASLAFPNVGSYIAQLETELNQATAQNEALRGALERLVNCVDGHALGSLSSRTKEIRDSYSELNRASDKARALLTTTTTPAKA